MKTTMKKVLSMALALVLLLGCLPMAVLADTVCEFCHGTGHSATDPHCTTCGAYGHDASASHCGTCHWVSTAGHDPACATLFCSECGAAKHTGYCCTTCNNNGHTPAAKHCDICNWVDGAGHDPACTTLLCDKCGLAKHEGYCCTTCNNYGHTSTASHCATCHWVSTAGHDPACATLFCDVCGAAKHTGYCCTICNSNGHTTSAPHCGECHKLLSEGHATGCTQSIVCPSCGKVGGTHYDNCMVPCTETADCTSKAHKITCVGPCTLAVNCTSKAHKENCLSKLSCTYCGQKGHVASACPDVFYSCGCSKSAGHKSDCSAVKWTVTFNPNYNTAAATSIGNVVSGTKLYDVYTPVRVGYTFEAWYYDANMTSIVPSGTTVTGPMTVYAKWKQIAPYNVSVVVYTNGNKNTPTVTLDLYSWAQDGVITLSDLKRAIEINGIKANNNAGLSVYGPFTPDQWTSYIAHDYYRNATEKVNVKNNETTVLYAMVHNVKITKGTVDPYGAIADKTNPKTGDMIFAPVAVMGLSVSALAVLLYLNKKRAF